MTKKALLIALLTFFFFLFSPPAFCEKAGRSDLVNFSHLDLLKFSFKSPDGLTMYSWAIYAEPVDKENPDGDYRPVEAPGEGYACVDDVARIALIYMNDYEKNGDEKSLKTAREALDFLLYMHDGEGGFYNFIDRKGIINKTGHTSKTGLDWWTARAFRALGKGMGIFEKTDSEYAKKMESAFLKTLEKLEKYRHNPEVSPDIIYQYKMRNITPGTLVNDSGAITSLYTLGLLEYYRFRKCDRSKSLILDFCGAMARMEETERDKYPLTGFHYPTIWNTDMVHLYGNRQMEALAAAGRELGNEAWINSARREADVALPLIISSRGLPFALSPGPEEFPQIAYSVETVVSNLAAVHRATGRQKYAVLAGLAGAWFFGDNPRNNAVYLPYRGRCQDGVDANGINKNSGAESTIEALWAMQNLTGTPGESCLHFVCQPDYDKQAVIIPCRDMKLLSGKPGYPERIYEGGIREKIVHLTGPAKIGVKARLENPGLYRAYLIYHKKGVDGSARLDIKLGDREKPVYLTGSRDSYQYKCTCLGQIRARENSIIPLEIKSDAQKSDIRLDSVILQPHLQYKVWRDGDRHILMILNSSHRPQMVPVDFDAVVKSSEGTFFSGDDVMKINIPAHGWVLFRI